MKQILSVMLYLAIALLCSLEVAPKLLASMEHKPSNVLYVAHSDEKVNASETIDYKQLLEQSGAHSEMRF
jgi:hypothetical protein